MIVWSMSRLCNERFRRTLHLINMMQELIERHCWWALLAVQRDTTRLGSLRKVASSGRVGGGGGHLGEGETAIAGIGGALVRRQLGDRSVLMLWEETTAAVPGQGHHGLAIEQYGVDKNPLCLRSSNHNAIEVQSDDPPGVGLWGRHPVGIVWRQRLNRLARRGFSKASLVFVTLQRRPVYSCMIGSGYTLAKHTGRSTAYADICWWWWRWSWSRWLLWWDIEGGAGRELDAALWVFYRSRSWGHRWNVLEGREATFVVHFCHS